ncbi:Retrovirus-related Pol polyprotein from transposon TNT 1-94 [Sesbania bispinosa]|nr:Retrovirus-related Pol polyprotein from transposon TNT 1-94 [Sesbania bispinosa]
MQQPQEVEEIVEVLGEPHSPPQQQTASLDSTPGRVRSFEDIYETCNFAILEPKSFEAASKQHNLV